MKKFLYKIKSKFLTFFGDIRFSKLPPFLFYDDIEFAVHGNKIKEIMDILEPGDVILRGYDHYLDGLFIKSSRKYSHAGLYAGNGFIIHAVAPNVTKQHVIDFCNCDRIAVVRPSKYTASAIKMARKFLKDNIKYDFNFEHGKETLYCFELAACCYPKLQVDKKKVSIFGGLIKKKEPVYLSDSFFESKDFKLVYEYNPRFNIDFSQAE